MEKEIKKKSEEQNSFLGLANVRGDDDDKTFSTTDYLFYSSASWEYFFQKIVSFLSFSYAFAFALFVSFHFDRHWSNTLRKIHHFCWGVGFCFFGNDVILSHPDRDRERTLNEHFFFHPSPPQKKQNKDHSLLCSSFTHWRILGNLLANSRWLKKKTHYDQKLFVLRSSFVCFLSFLNATGPFTLRNGRLV